MNCFDAESFNSYKAAPALSSYTQEELVSSKAGPQGTATYDEMEYDPIATQRQTAESFKGEWVGQKPFQEYVPDMKDVKDGLVTGLLLGVSVGALYLGVKGWLGTGATIRGGK